MVIATPRLAACCCLSVALFAGAPPAFCQTTATPLAESRPPGVSPVAVPARSSVADDLLKPLIGDFKQLGSSRNLFLAGLGAGVALTSHPWDRDVARSAWADEAHDAFEPGKHVGSFLAQSGAALVTYAVGRTTGDARVAALGARLFRAQIVAQGTTQVIKFATQRTRPDGSALSFPSGHTAAAFATAAVLQDEFGWKAGLPAFAMAGWVATSRVQMDRHYLSDVIAGATVGLLAGRSLSVGKGPVRFSLTPMAVPGGIGVAGVRVTGR